MNTAGSTSASQIWSKPSADDWRNLHGAVAMHSSNALANARTHLQHHITATGAHPAATPQAHHKPVHLVGGAHPPLSHHQQLVKQTQKWVAQTFYGTLLKQMRNSPFKSKMFDGGRGGEAFGEMFDQQLADRMSRGAGGKLVDTIVNHIEARAAAVKQRVPIPKKVL